MLRVGTEAILIKTLMFGCSVACLGCGLHGCFGRGSQVLAPLFVLLSTVFLDLRNRQPHAALVALVGPLFHLLAHSVLLFVVGRVCFCWLLAAPFGCIGVSFVALHVVVLRLLLSTIVLLVGLTCLLHRWIGLDLSLVVLLVKCTFLLRRCTVQGL